jgi:hypothetical protein
MNRNPACLAYASLFLAKALALAAPLVGLPGELAHHAVDAVSLAVYFTLARPH